MFGGRIRLIVCRFRFGWPENPSKRTCFGLFLRANLLTPNLLTPARREMALAVIELYKRIKERKNNSKTIRASTDVYEVMHPYMADLKVEECWAIYLNQAARIIRKQRISVGGLASTQVDVRVILREALTCNATSMILCHNHPSGNTRPSQDDDRLTHSLLEAGRTMNIRLLDHVIVADGSHYSYGDEGRL